MRQAFVTGTNGVWHNEKFPRKLCFVKSESVIIPLDIMPSKRKTIRKTRIRYKQCAYRNKTPVLQYLWAHIQNATIRLTEHSRSRSTT